MLTQPTANFLADDTIICAGDSVQFTNSSDPITAATQWNFGDAASGPDNSSNAANPSHTYNLPGIYTVTLQTVVGSCTSSKTQLIHVHQPSVPPFTGINQNNCQIPAVVNFSNNQAGIASWLWNFGDSTSATNTSTQQNPSHTYTQNGYYAVALIVTDSFGCSNADTILNYIFVAEPQLNILKKDSGCIGTRFDFTALVLSPADSIITSYTWNFGDGSAPVTTTTDTVSHVYSVVGIYNVTLSIVTSTGCTATITEPGFIRVGTQPQADFSWTPDSVCFQESVTFTDLTPQPVTGWLWSFGDGGSSTDQNPVWIYQNDTSRVPPFTVQLIAYYNGCPDTIRKDTIITVLGPIPFFVPTFDCNNPNTVVFTDASHSPDTWLWDFGDSSPTVGTVNPIHTYPGRGTYPVTLTTFSVRTGCTVDTIITIQITDPIAQIVAPNTVGCFPQQFNFLGGGSQDASQYLWTFGEGIPGVLDTSFADDTLHLYNTAPGIYMVHLTVTDIHGCTSVDSQQVSVNGPTAGFTAVPATGCAPINVLFTDTSTTVGSNIVNHFWDFGNGTQTNTTNDTISLPYSVPGQYTITLIVTDGNGCMDTIVRPNFVNPSRPVAAINMVDTFGCRNVSEAIIGLAGSSATQPVTYHWNFGDGQMDTTQTVPVNHSYANNGAYTIHLTVIDANGCLDSTTRNNFCLYYSWLYSIRTKLIPVSQIKMV